MAGCRTAVFVGFACDLSQACLIKPAASVLAAIARTARAWHDASMGRKRSLYHRVRWFVDRDQSQLRSITLIFGTFPIVVGGLIQSLLDDADTTIVWVTAIGASVAWTAFVCWRMYRLTKAYGLRRDRQFDTRDRFLLPPEYRSAESVTKARRRRRSQERSGG